MSQVIASAIPPHQETQRINMGDTAPENIILADRDGSVERQSDDAAQPDPERSFLKLMSAAFSFFVAGLNDGSLGALLPYVLQTWALSLNLVVVM